VEAEDSLFHGGITPVYQRTLRYISFLLSLLATVSTASFANGVHSYSCTLQNIPAEYQPWLPKAIAIVFKNNGLSSQVSYGYSYDSLLVTTNNPLRKAVSGTKKVKASDGKTYLTRHYIDLHGTNLKTLTYSFSIDGTDMNVHVSGSCKRAGGLSENYTYRQKMIAKLNVSKSCIIDEKKCDSLDICTASTERLNGRIVWRGGTAYSEFVKEARIRGLTCNVYGEGNSKRSQKTQIVSSSNASNSASSSYICKNNPKACDLSDLCKKATNWISGKTMWKTNATASRYVAEAKQRQLSCGVTLTLNTTTNNVVKSTSTRSTYKANSQTSKPMSGATDSYKRQCSDIGYTVGTEKHADCVMQLMQMANNSQNTNAIANQAAKSKPTYAQAERICEAEASAMASSTYRPVTPTTRSYTGNCTSYGNTSVNCNISGGVSPQQGFNNFANALSKRNNKYKLFSACMLRLGYTPPKQKGVLESIFGGNK